MKYSALVYLVETYECRIFHTINSITYKCSLFSGPYKYQKAPKNRKAHQKTGKHMEIPKSNTYMVYNKIVGVICNWILHENTNEDVLLTYYRPTYLETKKCSLDTRAWP